MNKQHFVNQVLKNEPKKPQRDTAQAFAPSNIALCKYWGKRDTTLNLPVTSSLSIALGDYGTTTHITVHDKPQDDIFLNDTAIQKNTEFYRRITDFLNLYRDTQYFRIDSQSNIPIAAGLASSASGFASLTLALAKLYNWSLDKKHLSLLARLGSGSAARSLWQGFVEWHKGNDAFSSLAEPFEHDFPNLRIGFIIINKHTKKISSRDAMERTVKTSPLYNNWPRIVEHDLALLKKAIIEKDFELLGKTAEHNAIKMHETMKTATPSIDYCEPETHAIIDKVKKLREQSIPVYYTQDAGPNIKLLFLENARETIQKHLPSSVIA